MLYDVIYLLFEGILPPSALPYQKKDLKWGSYVDSDPTLQNFKINWRPHANHVIIVFSDEQGQSYLTSDVAAPFDPNTGGPYGGYINQNILVSLIPQDPRLSIYTFSPFYHKSGAAGWEPLSIVSEKGKWYPLSNSTTEIYNHLSEILSETACGEESAPTP